MSFLLFLLYYKQFFLSFEKLSPLIVKNKTKKNPFINDHQLLKPTLLKKQSLIFFLNHVTLG